MILAFRPSSVASYMTISKLDKTGSAVFVYFRVICFERSLLSHWRMYRLTYSFAVRKCPKSYFLMARLIQLAQHTLVCLRFSYTGKYLVVCSNVEPNLFSISNCNRYEAKRVITREGHPPAAFYFVLSGAGNFLSVLQNVYIVLS